MALSVSISDGETIEFFCDVEDCNTLEHPGSIFLTLPFPPTSLLARCQRRNGVVRLLNLTEGLRIWVDNEPIGTHESVEVQFGDQVIIHSNKYVFEFINELQIVNGIPSSSPSTSSQHRGEIYEWALFFGLNASTGTELVSGIFFNVLELVLDNNKSGEGEFLSMKTLINDTQELSDIAELSFFCLRILAERANDSLASFVTSCYYTGRAVDGEVMLTLPYLLSMAIKRLPVPVASLVLCECLLEPALSLKGGAFQLMNEHKCLAELLTRTHPDGYLILIESIIALLVCSSTEETKMLPFMPRLMDIVAWRLRIALSIPKFLPSSPVSVAKFRCDESFSTSKFTRTTLRLLRANEQILNVLFVVYNTMQSRSEKPSGMKSVHQPRVEVLQQMSFATLKLMLDDLALTRKISVPHLRKLVLQSKTSADSTRALPPPAGYQSPTRSFKAKSHQKQVFSWGTSVSFPDLLRLILNISEHLIDDLKQEVGGIFGYMNKSSAGRKMGLRFSPLFSLPFAPEKRKSDVVQNSAPASSAKQKNIASPLSGSPLNSLRKKLFD